jgi:hypothetical protein
MYNDELFNGNSIDHKFFSLIFQVSELIDRVELSNAVKDNLKYIKKELEISYNAYKKQL